MVSNSSMCAPTIFYAPDRSLFVTSCSRARQLSASGRTFAYVYRSSGGRTGFDGDPSIQKAVQEMLGTSWILYEKDELFCPTSRFGEKILVAIREGMIKGTVVSHEPSATLLDEFKKVSDYKMKLKAWKIKQRAGRAYPEPTQPKLADLILRGTTDPELLDFVAAECGFVTLWRYSEFGLYFVGLDGKYQADAFIQGFANAKHIAMEKLSDVRYLPTW